jgi:hypothetical protein
MENHTESDWFTTWHNFVIGLLKQAVFKHVRKVVYVIRYCRENATPRGENGIAAHIKSGFRGIFRLPPVYRTSTIPSTMSYTLYRLLSSASLLFSRMRWTHGGV